ncbi:replicative DNA helicase [Frigoriglobus tundricola]|uniref:DNA 5'-3' helicase n=1 Tax=Frigoriglobus tundricola TaxID=2774151 RepID=A0A6M5YGI1_9BACT|nr:replicative DNA helicase [Frigoriglobus tundricola]QJW93098.1 Replicative DNA helicase (DnaB) [Frigoriglobus tundricola]
MNVSMPVPPQNLEAERAVLGAILRDSDVLADVLAVVRPEAMYFDHHRRILTAAVDIAQRGAPVDLVVLYDELRKRKWLEDVGGETYLIELWEAVPTGANAAYHAKLIADAALLRSLIHSANETIRDAYSPTAPAEDLLAQAERRLFAINADNGADVAPRCVGEVAREALIDIDSRIAAGATLAGLSTGFVDLDRMLGGLRPGQLVVIGARPSIGKTAFALNVADRVASGGAPVLFFSLEMPAREITDRLISMRSGVPMSRMGRPRDLRPDDLTALTDAAAELSSTPLYIEDAGDVTAARVAAVSRRACRRLGAQLVVVDYLSLLRPENPKENRTLQVGTLALRVKQMSRSLGVPVLLLSQLNRELEHANRRPRLADLRDSGEVEQHADCVLFLHREQNLPVDDPVWPVEVIVAKNRNGPVGEIGLAYRRPVLRFENAAVGR